MGPSGLVSSIPKTVDSNKEVFDKGFGSLPIRLAESPDSRQQLLGQSFNSNVSYLRLHVSTRSVCYSLNLSRYR